jgi:hypothetical protein
LYGRLPPGHVVLAPASDRGNTMGAILLLTRQIIYDRSVEHLLEWRRVMLDRSDEPDYRRPCGGSPVTKLIRPVDFTPAMAGVSVRLLLAFASGRSAYLDAGIADLRSALFRARVNVYHERTVALLSELQDVYDFSGFREWPHRLRSIARDHGLDCERAYAVHGHARTGEVWTFGVGRDRGDR